MYFNKVKIIAEKTINDRCIFTFNLTEDGKLIFRRYYKEDILQIDDLAEFSSSEGHLKMKHPTDDNIALLLVSCEVIDLENISEKLCSENANILYAITESNDVGLYNRDIETYLSKADNSMTRKIYNHSVVFNIFKPRINGPVENVIIHVNNDEDFFINLPNLIDNGTKYPTLNKINIRITGSDTIAQEGIETYELQVVDASGATITDEGIELYLKSDCGLVSHNKIKTDSTGKATVKVKGTMLDAGEQIELKVGFKYYSNLDSKVINVI